MKSKRSLSDIAFNIIFPIIMIIVAIIVVAVPLGIAMKGENCVDRTVLNKDGSDIVGYSMEDIKNVGYFEFVNHFPNKYVSPQEIGTNGKIEKINELTLAPSGTLQFVIFNYDKNDPNIDEYLKDETFYSPITLSNLVSFYIPFAYDAASIWVNGEYYTTNGNIKDYNSEDFAKPGNTHSIDLQPIKPSRIVCALTVDKNEISEDRFEAASVITIHYQAKRGVNFQNNIPVFGNTDTILHTTSIKFNTALSGVIILALLLIFAFAILMLKLYVKKLPYLGIVFGAFLLNIGQYCSFRYSVIIGKYVTLIAFSIMILFTIVSCKPRTSNKPLYTTWISTITLSSLNVLILCFIGWYMSYKSVVLYSQIVFITLILLEHVFAITRIHHSTMMEITGIIVALVVPILGLFFHFSLIWFVNPCVLLVNISAVVFIWNITDSIRTVEIKNKKLTENLMAEVAVQTHSLHDAIQDRELLISFISHDLRKASLSIDNLATQIIEDRDRINSPIAEKIKNKNDIILTSLSDISSHMKQNYTSEDFNVVKVNTIFENIYNLLAPDCEAYGITLSYDESNYSLRTKQNAITSIITNLIFNSIEHAECKNIKLYSKKSKDKIKIFVHDDGKGIPENKDVFSPFITDNNNETNMGLGLFLVKSEIESLGGSISYEFDNGAKFIITLLREF